MNLSNKLGLCIVLLSLTSLSLAQESSATEKVEDHCDADQFDEVHKSLLDLDELRTERDNQFTDNWKEIIDFLSDPSDNSEDLIDAFKATFIIIIIFAGLILITFIIFLIFCCGCCKEREGNNTVWVVISWFFFILFVAAFVLIIIYIALSQSKVDDTLCAIFKVPSGIIDGFEDDHYKYLGLANYRSTLANFAVEMDQLPNVSGNTANIVVQDVGTLSNQAWARLITYTQNARLTKITDGRGLKRHPDSVIQLTPGINNAIEMEFIELDLASEKVTQGASDAQFFNVGLFRSSVKSAIDEIVVNIQRVITEIEDVVEPGADHVEDGLDYAKIGYWILFGFAIFLILICALLMLILCCQCSFNKCWDKNRLGRFLLVIIGFCTMVLAVLTIIILIGSVVMSGFCGFIGKINKNQVSVLYEYKDDIDQEVIDYAELCIFSNSTGDLTTLVTTDTKLAIQSSYLSAIDNILDGFSSYRLLKTQYGTSTSSVHVPLYGNFLDELKLGREHDFDNIQTTLDDLNDLIDCNDENFALDVSLCTETGCKGIRQTTTYTAPVCSANTAVAEQHFDNLKKYLTEESAYVNNRKTALLDQNTQSVQKRFQTAKTAFIGLNNDSLAVENKLSLSLKATQDFNGAWREIDDCRTLRKTLIDFEIETCFEFNYYLYILMVIVSVSLLVLWILSWFMCIALIYVKESEKIEEAPPVPVNTQETNVYMDDREKIPFY